MLSQTSRTRLFLWCSLALLLLLLWSKWEMQFEPSPATSVSVSSPVNSSNSSSDSFVPNPVSPANLSSGSTNSPAPIQAKIASIQTDVLNLQVNLQDGNINQAELLLYPESLSDKSPVKLLYQSLDGEYLAQSGLLSTDLGSLIFHTNTPSVQLKPGQNQVELVLNAASHGILIHKIYTLHRGSYQVSVSYVIENHSGKPWQGNLYGQVVRTPPNAGDNLYTKIATFVGGVISTPEKRYETLSFKNIAENPPAETLAQGGWVAMVQHYFITAWIPNAQTQNQFYAKAYDQNNFGVGSISPSITIPPGQAQTVGGRFYIGPTLTRQLNATAPYLSLTIDYGWLFFIAKYLFLVLRFIHNLVGNWGWSIVIITLLLKALFFPLSHKSYSSMAKMRVLQPKMKALQEAHQGDRQGLQKAIMELYTKEGVNPLGGCLPILIQIPIFIALYWMLMASVELRQAPFIFWIQDLSVHDPYYVLPILTGVLMLSQQLLSPKPADKIQMYVMMSMPIVFTLFMMRLPAGLGLYMVVNIGISILQQYLITRSTQKQVLEKARHHR